MTAPWPRVRCQCCQKPRRAPFWAKLKNALVLSLWGELFLAGGFGCVFCGGLLRHPDLGLSQGSASRFGFSLKVRHPDSGFLSRFGIQIRGFSLRLGIQIRVSLKVRHPDSGFLSRLGIQILVSLKVRFQIRVSLKVRHPDLGSFQGSASISGFFQGSASKFGFFLKSRIRKGHYLDPNHHEWQTLTLLLNLCRFVLLSLLYGQFVRVYCRSQNRANIFPFG